MVLAALSAIPVGPSDNSDSLSPADLNLEQYPNNYSFALHAQSLGPWAIRIPRVILAKFGFVVAAIVGCFAALCLDDILQTLLSDIGYWTVIHITGVIERHLIFRRGWASYDFNRWNNPSVLSFGWASMAAFALGFLGVALGMRVTWYKGPIASLIGGSGANKGPELTFAVSGIVFPVLRWIEKRAGNQ